MLKLGPGHALDKISLEEAKARIKAKNFIEKHGQDAFYRLLRWLCSGESLAEIGRSFGFSREYVRQLQRMFIAELQVYVPHPVITDLTKVWPKVKLVEYSKEEKQAADNLTETIVRQIQADSIDPEVKWHHIAAGTVKGMKVSKLDLLDGKPTKSGNKHRKKKKAEKLPPSTP